MKHLPNILIRTFHNEADGGETDAGQQLDHAAGAGSETDTPDPSQVMLLVNSQGQAFQAPNVGLPDGAQVQLSPQQLQYLISLHNSAGSTGGRRLDNASSSLALTQDERLTGFAIGWPGGELTRMADFLAPRVDAGLRFDYRVKEKKEAFGVIADDLVGIAGMPPVVTFDEDAKATGKLTFRGVTMHMHTTEMDAYDAEQGWSGAQEWEERLMQVMEWLERGRILRILSGYNTASGNATAKTWDSSAKPLEDLETALDALSPYVGGRGNIAIGMGSTAWRITRYQKTLAGDGTNNPQRPPSLQEFAVRLRLRPENVEVFDGVYTSSKQGKTGAYTSLFGADELRIFVRTPQPSRMDQGTAKTFTMRRNGQIYRVLPFGPMGLPQEFMSGRIVDYWDLVKVTNSGNLYRWSISDGS